MDDHVEELLRDLANEDGMDRKRARETLTLVGEPAVPRLRALLAGPGKRARWEAAKALGTMIDPDSVDEFVRLLDDPSSDLRWLAATGLIELGPRSARPVLRSLAGTNLPRGRLEMSRRVLGELAKDNGVLAGIVGPLLDALGGNDAGVMTAAAARALSDLDRITGRLPDLDAPGGGAAE